MTLMRKNPAVSIEINVLILTNHLQRWRTAAWNQHANRAKGCINHIQAIVQCMHLATLPYRTKYNLKSAIMSSRGACNIQQWSPNVNNCNQFIDPGNRAHVAARLQVRRPNHYTALHSRILFDVRTTLVFPGIITEVRVNLKQFSSSGNRHQIPS